MRALTGLFLSIIIALVARSRRTLTTSGAIAAIAVATATWSAGWIWGATLIAFFLTSTLLSQLGAARKQNAIGDIVAKGAERDWKQVIANGGPYGAAALLSLVSSDSIWMLAGVGALAASTADTWATEIGTLSSSPRSIITWRAVPTGTSGGVTLYGTLAAFVGACFIGAFVCVAGWPFTAFRAALTGGFAGSVFDSLLGATVQSRRWCEHCNSGTERAVHGCGHSTKASGGIFWLDNDMVNLLSSISGALIGAMWVS
jgi:uncharacterized protein (TIGR00297 family)